MRGKKKREKGIEDEPASFEPNHAPTAKSTFFSCSPTIVTPRCLFPSAQCSIPYSKRFGFSMNRNAMSYQGDTWAAIRYGAGRFGYDDP